MEKIDIKNLTNIELFQEFRRCGFFIIHNNIENLKYLDATVVSVEEPKKNTEFHKKKKSLESK